MLICIRQIIIVIIIIEFDILESLQDNPTKGVEQGNAKAI